MGDEVSADKPSESRVVDLGKRSSVGPVSLAFEAESTNQGLTREKEAYCVLGTQTSRRLAGNYSLTSWSLLLKEFGNATGFKRTE